MVLLCAFAFLIAPGSYATAETETCLPCHDQMPRTLDATAHQLAGDSLLASPIKVSCSDCHDGWQEHLDNPVPENISTPTKLSLTEQADVCSRCHLTAHQQTMVSTDPHLRVGLGCGSCHQVHGSNSPYLVKEPLENYCLSCHSSVEAEFRSRSAHPLFSGNVGCVDCHKLSQNKDPLVAVGFDWTCQNCHSDLAGPFLHEHPVVYNHLVEGRGCTECHAPHGSPNDRLLKQSDKGTCLQCHMTPPGHFTNHAGLGSKLPCYACHSEIHGSYDNALFLDPDLGMKLFADCYQSGCHAQAVGRE